MNKVFYVSAKAVEGKSVQVCIGCADQEWGRRGNEVAQRVLQERVS